jgi:hypothetical protein
VWLTQQSTQRSAALAPRSLQVRLDGEQDAVSSALVSLFVVAASRAAVWLQSGPCSIRRAAGATGLMSTWAKTSTLSTGLHTVACQAHKRALAPAHRSAGRTRYRPSEPHANA